MSDLNVTGPPASPRGGGRPAVTAATCRIRAAHRPHELCPGTAPEFPWEPVIDPAAGLQAYAAAGWQVDAAAAAQPGAVD